MPARRQSDTAEGGGRPAYLARLLLERAELLDGRRDVGLDRGTSA